MTPTNTISLLLITLAASTTINDSHEHRFTVRNYKFNICAVICVIMLVFQFFPFGLTAICCLDNAKDHMCVHCGEKMPNSRKALYIPWAFLQLIFATGMGLIALWYYEIIFIYEEEYNDYNYFN